MTKIAVEKPTYPGLFGLKTVHILLMATVIFQSCAAMRSPDYSPIDFDKRKAEKRKNLVTTAETFLGRKFIKIAGRFFPNDCSGFVAAVFYKNGYNLMEASEVNNQNLVKIIYDHIDDNGTIFREGDPRPGDIVFFSNTYRSRENILSHIGIIEKVDKDGTITFIHKNSFGIIRGYMNLRFPSERQDEKNDKILNSYMRRKRPKDPPGQKYMAGELFEAYGNIIDSPTDNSSEEETLPDETKEESATEE